MSNIRFILFISCHLPGVLVLDVHGHNDVGGVRVPEEGEDLEGGVEGCHREVVMVSQLSELSVHGKVRVLKTRPRSRWMRRWKPQDV